MTGFIVRLPVANIPAANAALAAQNHGSGCFTIPIFTSGAMPSIATLSHIARDVNFRAHCAALAGATFHDFSPMTVDMNAVAVAAGGRWGGNAPLLQGNVIARFASEIAGSAITAKAGSLLKWTRTL